MIRWGSAYLVLNSEYIASNETGVSVSTPDGPRTCVQGNGVRNSESEHNTTLSSTLDMYVASFRGSING